MKLKPIPPQGIVGEVALREAAASEFGDIMNIVREALAKLFGLPSLYDVYVDSYWPDRVIMLQKGRYWSYPYTINDANQVTIGAPVEVNLDYKPVTTPLREAAASAWFLEAVAAEDETKPSRYLVRVIRAGPSKNGVNYPASVLREAAPLFDGVRVFVKEDDQHLKGGGKDFRQLVGRLVEPRFVEAKKGAEEIQAVLEVLESSDVADKLREAVTRGMTDLFGLSIDADGTTKKTTGNLREATKVLRVASVDLIIDPGAGGQVIRFAEAHQEPDMLRTQLLDQIRSRDAHRAAQLENASDDEVLTAYREAVATTSQTTVNGVTQEHLQQVIRLTEARADARVRIAGSKLPQAAKDRLIQRFAEATEINPEDVDAAIAAEDSYGKAFREAAPVQGLGSFIIEEGKSRKDVITGMLDDFFQKKGPIKSFREAYVEITGDTNLTGQFRQCDASRLAEAAGTFREAVSAATFGDILGDSITRQMLREYNANDLYGDWRWLVDVVPVRDFRTNERTRMGGYGNLPAVAENGPYAALTTPGDEKASYAVSKRGGTETISIEAIANDDVSVIRRIPGKLSMSAARTLYQFIFDFLSTNPTIYDTVALFHATHANLGTAALDATSLAAARLRLQKQTEADSGKRLGLVMKHLVVPAELEETARNLFARNTNNDPTFVNTLNPVIHVSPYWTDANNWFVTADQSQVQTIEIGFLNGNEEPELFVQDNPTQGSLFTNDQIKYKIRHIYGGNVVDYRGLDGSVVA